MADLDAVAARLAEAGVTMISRAPWRIDEPGTPWHGGPYLLTRDPDGVIVELVGVLPARAQYDFLTVTAVP